jgi:hypothetical protein
MFLKYVIETLASSPIWNSLELPEKAEETRSVVQSLRDRNIVVEEDVDIAEIIGEVYGGKR